MSGGAVPDEAECGRRDDAHDREAVTDERDVDRVFEPSGDEFAGPVQRVDQHECGAGFATAPLLAGFLRNDRYPRKDTGQSGQDRRMRGIVCLGHWRIVGLVAGLRLAEVDRQDRQGGLDRDRAESLRKLCVGWRLGRFHHGIGIPTPYTVRRFGVGVYHTLHPIPWKALVSGDLSPMSATVTLEALDLAALLCSRVCHDLISPVGAVVNGIEVMEDDADEQTKTFA